MKDAVGRRVSGWKILGLVAGAVMVLAIATMIWMKVAVDRGLEEWGRNLKGAIAADRDRSGARPVLVGQAKPGNAWDDYTLALAECQKIPGAKTGEILDPKHDDKPDGPLAKLPLYASAIAHLREGARRASAKYDYDWEKGASSSMPPFVAASRISSFALLEARVHAKEGKLSEAAGEILDVIQFGRDFASDGPILSHMVGGALLANALQEARDLVAAGTTDPASQELLEHGLQALLEKFPAFEDALLRECLFMDSALQEAASTNFAVGFALLSSARRQRDWIQRSAAAGRISWAEVLKVDGEIQGEIARAWNPYVKMGGASLTMSGGKPSRQWRTQASLLLAAVHFQRTGVILVVDDPFGSQLCSSRTGDTLKTWSLGPDGVDNQGAGGWKMQDGPDIVFEVKR